MITSLHCYQKQLHNIIICHKYKTAVNVFENIILHRIEDYLWTTDNQFGFKAHHSTDLYVYALTEFIEYFKSRSTSVYVAFLDASKAFDKINHWLLFKKMIDRQIPLYLIKILCYWYRNQAMYVSGVQLCPLHFK